MKNFEQEADQFLNQLLWSEADQKRYRVLGQYQKRLDTLLGGTATKSEPRLHELRNFATREVKRVFIAPNQKDTSRVLVVVNTITPANALGYSGQVDLEDFVLYRNLNIPIIASKAASVPLTAGQSLEESAAIPHRIFLDTDYGPTSAMIVPGQGYSLPVLTPNIRPNLPERRMFRRIPFIHKHLYHLPTPDDVNAVYEDFQRGARLVAALEDLSDQTLLQDVTVSFVE